MKCFVIWDTRENKPWVTPRGKLMWTEPGHAKNAWNIQQKYGTPKFNKQARFECRPATVSVLTEKV